MPATTTSPQPHLNNKSISMSGKRKRDGIDNEVDGKPMTTSNGVDEETSSLQEWFKDALEILRSYDDGPILFDRELSSSSPSKPSPKRQKITAAPTQSISSKIENQSYSTVDELLKDLGDAEDARTKELDDKVGDGSLTQAASSDEKEKIARVRRRFQALFAGEVFLHPRKFKHTTEESTQQNELKAPDGGHLRSQNSTILTVFGGERHPRQLFSSKAISTGRDISDVPLFNGISTTDVVPIHSIGEKADKVSTIGQAFPPSSNLKPLAPPKPSSKHTSTRSTSINWYNPVDSLPATKESSARDPYSKQSLPVGRWLSYNVAPSTESMTSADSKRKHRDRALSTGEPQSAIDAETTAAHAQARDDALFRSAFSSFAPSRDDTGAIVSQEQRNRMWWSRHGEARFNEALDIRDEELGSNVEPEMKTEAEEIDDKLLEEGIETWDFAFEADDSTKRGSVEEEGSIDALLEEISELLEILDSHQRTRNLSQSSTSRPLPGVPNERLNTVASDYLTPSKAEVEVHDTLKAQLIEVISSLPPFALAKLDSDKLGALTINAKVKTGGKFQRGNLQEDPLSNKPRPPVNPHPPAATNVRQPYTTTPNHSFNQRNNYNSTPGQRPAASQNSYNYSGGRPSSQYTQGGSGTTRQNYSQPYQPQQRANTSFVDRFANGQLGPQQTPLSYSQYPNHYRSPSGQGSNTYPQQPQQYPNSGPANRGPTPSSQYQSQTGQRGGGGGYQYTPSRPNPAFGAGGQGQQRPPLAQQHSSHYGATKSPQPNGVGPAAQRTSMGREAEGSPA